MMANEREYFVWCRILARLLSILSIHIHAILYSQRTNHKYEGTKGFFFQDGLWIHHAHTGIQIAKCFNANRPRHVWGIYSQ